MLKQKGNAFSLVLCTLMLTAAYSQGQTTPAQLDPPGVALIEVADGRYHFNGTFAKWHDGKVFCETVGMHLATIETGVEAFAIHNASLAAGSNLNRLTYWTSGSDIGHQPGHFYWSDGTEVGANLWSKDEPNQFGTGKETCVVLLAGKLSDLKCSSRMPFLCETTPPIKAAN